MSSFLIAGCSFVVLEPAAVALCACAGARLLGGGQQSGRAARDQPISGTTMIGFGAMLALAQRPVSRRGQT